MVTGTENSDMNKSASGKYIYLYYNRSEKSGLPGYTELDVLYRDYEEMLKVPDGWELVSSDMNETAGRLDIYLIAKRA